ncbi:hypothetical protein [Parasphingorhabdus sp.]|uniref:hypothetical protein n=1 Tax=Parasphingorhabdus sp. TaxID=2709688 RepID=UPI003A9477D9
MEQGQFYTFLSLAAAQFFFDLGAGFVLANIAGREMADAGSDDPHDMHVESFEKLKPVIVFALRWSAVAGTVLIGILGIVGYLLFSDGGPDAAYLTNIWLVYVLFISFTMIFHLFLRMFEGVGFVVEAALSRSIQSFVNIVSLYIFAAMGFGIISMVFAAIIALLVAAVYFLASSRQIRSSFQNLAARTSDIKWIQDILPFQTKVAMTWLSGYVIFQSQIPFLYRFAGPIEAGKMGIAVQVLQALNTSVNIFLVYNIKSWTNLAKNNDFASLNRDFLKVLLFTVTLMIMACALILSGVFVLDFYDVAIVDRFPSLSLLTVYAIAACFNQIFFALGYYFRARGEEPLWWLSVLASIGILAVPIVLQSKFDVESAIYSFAAFTIFFLGILAPIFGIYYIRKHQATISPAKMPGVEL